MSTIAFTVCFAVWTIFSIIGIQIQKDLGLNETQFGLLVGTPILTGSLIRIFLGIWTDQYGGRLVYTLTMLAAAVATFLLTYATTYPQMLVAALGVGIAGGSFAVGIAYVSRWYPTEKQGTALGIFGAGNVGAAVTKFIAPFVLVAYGWHAVAEIWAAAIAIMAIVFWFTTKDDPVLVERRAKRLKPKSAWLELEPLKNVQVWRFSLYYFFVFGAFVALALWLPRYLIGVYGLDITTAGMIGAAYSVPASIFRAYGGHLSDKYGARRIMYWTFAVSVLVTFILSYPPTEYIVQGISGPISFHLETGVVTFTVLVFVLGFFMSLGKAAVYKHIPVYYPKNVGAVGGLVGMIGGLGGFVLPIAFGVLNDLTGIWTSCFMLLFLLAGVALLWMHLAIRRMESEAREPSLQKLPQLPEMEAIHEEKHVGALGPAIIEDWRPEDKAFWEETGRAIARRNLWISIPALLLAFAVWMVWSVVVAKLPAVGFKFTTDQLFWLAAMPGLSGATLRIFYSFMVPIFGGRLWTTLATWSLMIPAIGIGFAVQNPDTPYIIFLVLALLCGFGGGNFASSMANICFFFPKAEKGNALALNAGLGNLGVSVVQFVVPLVITAGVFGWLGGDPQMATKRRGHQALAAERRLHLGAVHRRLGHRGLVRHERHRRDEGLVRRAGGDLPAQAQLDHVLALHRHLRLLHRLFGGLPAARQDPVPAGRLAQASSSSARWSARCRARRPAGCRTTTAAAASPSGSSSLMIAAVGGVLYFLGIKDQPGAFWGFFAMFMVLFFATGVGNASTFQMIPAIMRAEMPRLEPELGATERAQKQAEMESAAIIGFTSAIAAYGAFFIPKSYGTSIALTGGPEMALWGFLVFYVTCIAVTWCFYTRRGGLLRDIERGGTLPPAAAATG